MNCEETRAELIDYRHRELAAERASSVAAHLSGCSACALEYCRLDAELSGISELLTETPRREVYLSLKSRVMSEFRLPWWRRLFRPLFLPLPIYQPLIVAAAAVVLWLIFSKLDVRSAQTEVVVDNFDASTHLEIDPDLL